MTAQPTIDDVTRYVRLAAGGRIPAPAQRRIVSAAMASATPVIAAHRAVDAYLAEVDETVADASRQASRQTHADRTAAHALGRIAGQRLGRDLVAAERRRRDGGAR